MAPGSAGQPQLSAGTREIGHHYWTHVSQGIMFGHTWVGYPNKRNIDLSWTHVSLSIFLDTREFGRLWIHVSWVSFQLWDWAYLKARRVSCETRELDILTQAHDPSYPFLAHVILGYPMAHVNLVILVHVERVSCHTWAWPSLATRDSGLAFFLI